MKTTTREYNSKGKLVKETIVETADPPSTLPRAQCMCWQPYWRTAPFCPVHGYARQQPYTITSGTYPRPHTVSTTSGITTSINVKAVDSAATAEAVIRRVAMLS